MVTAQQEPETDLQVLSERFLEVATDQATDIFGACVILVPPNSTSPFAV